MTKKIYLVNYEDGYDDVNTYVYCSTLEIAEKEKQLLERAIRALKTTYKLKHKSDYDKDYETVRNAGLGEHPFPKNYEELRNRVYTFQSEYEEVGYQDIFIKEEELL